jgi:hypothetical protein
LHNRGTISARFKWDIALKGLAKSSLDRPKPTTDIPATLSMSMRIGRTILTFLVALSLAMAPGAGAFAMQKDEITASSVVASAHDCCDDEGMPADHLMKDCQASAGCATKCFNVYGELFSSATIVPPIGGTEAPFVSKPFYSQTTRPPFRPPRV